MHELKKYTTQTNTRPNGRKRTATSITPYYSIQLPHSVSEYISTKIHIRKFWWGYELSRFGEIQEGKHVSIKVSGALCIPTRLVEEFEDQGDYEIEFDYEMECVNLVKI